MLARLERRSDEPLPWSASTTVVSSSTCSLSDPRLPGHQQTGQHSARGALLLGEQCKIERPIARKAESVSPALAVEVARRRPDTSPIIVRWGPQ